MNNRDRKNKQYIVGILIQILFSIVCVIILSITDNLLTIAIVAILQLFVHILVLLKNFNLKVFSIPIIFIVFTFLTHLGHLPLNAFNINEHIPSFFDVINIVAENVYLNAIKFVIYSQTFLVFGIMVYLMSFNKEKYDINNHKEIIERKVVLKIGKIFFALGIFPGLYVDISKIILYLSGGYLNTYLLDTNGILYFFSNMWKFGIIMILIGIQDKITKVKIVYLASLIYLTIIMVSGNRLSSIMFILTITYIYFHVILKGKVKRPLFYCLIGYLLLVLVNFIGSYRNISFDQIELVTSLSKAFMSSALFDAMGEFGVTMISLCYSIMFFPAEISYGYGATYPLGFVTIIPNLLGMYDSIINHLIYVYNFPLGYVEALGGSYLGELYYNFGTIGIFFTLFIGMYIMFIEAKLRDSIKNRKWLVTIIYVSVVPFIFMWTRGYFKDLIRIFVWQYILIKLFYFYYLNKNTNYKKIHECE